jgi:hypothetical protein
VPTESTPPIERGVYVFFRHRRPHAFASDIAIAIACPRSREGLEASGTTRNL